MRNCLFLFYSFSWATQHEFDIRVYTKAACVARNNKCPAMANCVEIIKIKYFYMARYERREGSGPSPLPESGGKQKKFLH